MRVLKNLLVLLICNLTIFAFAQNTLPEKGNNNTPRWVDMIKDVSVNFYDIQKEANSYFDEHYTGKGSGWKQYKRWEYFTEQRVFPTGKRINHAQVWNEINIFRKNVSNNKALASSNWVNLGPTTSTNNTGHWSPGLGRINVIAVDPHNEMTIYAGTPSGGLWKTTNEGGDWNCLTDDLPVIGVSAVAIDPNNTDVVFIGTGDKDASDNYSIGVLKSTNGGESWNTTGLTWTIYENNTISKLIINPDNTDIIFAASTFGVFKSIDAGETWDNVLTGDIDDIEFKPGDPNIIYAITKKFYKSVDGGESFTEISGLPTGSRAQIAVSNDNPEYVYFFSSESGIYRSENSGDSFSKRSSQPNQGSQSWYDLAFCVSHTNAEEVHLGEINTWKSVNGGTSWIQTTDWTWNNPIGYTHCDIHEMVFYGNTLYVGSDGLITKSTDGASTFTNLSEGLSIRQLYRIGTSKNDPYKLMGGAQDNGTSVYSTDHWHDWLGADGMECVVDYSNSDIVYGTSQYGTFYKSNAGGNYGSVAITQPGAGNWITPMVIHPQNPETLFVGNSEVQKTEDGMQSWTQISSLGVGNLNCMAISESNPDYLFVSKDDKIFRTKDGGGNWENISSGLPELQISYIAIHPENYNTIAVSLSGYTEGEKVYISYDAGNNWENYSKNLPNLPANCVTFFIGSLVPIYVGMDVGVYYMDNLMDDWTEFMTGLPNVVVNELEINIDAKLIRAATYGRGLWESPVHINAPISDFIADEITIPIGCNNGFSSLAQGPPETYEWLFEGATPSSSTEKNPYDIYYESEGTYDVQLIVTNSLGSDTLLKEDYITVSSTLLPESDFMADNINGCSNTEIEFTDLSSNCPDTWQWSFEPSTYTFSAGTDENSQNPVVIFNSGNYSVTLTTTNQVGSHTITKNNYINAGGALLPFVESYEFDNLADNGWTVLNPDNSNGWTMAEVGGNSPGNKAAMMDNVDYFNFGNRDKLISPVISFEGMDDVDLLFEHAYAQRYGQKDSLIVFISSDCGENWERIYAGGPDGNGIFATSAPIDTSFVPQTTDDWCGHGYGASCNIINLDNWAGMNNIMLMFEAYSQFGNKLYIDNVEISNHVGINDSPNKYEISIVPNPNTGVFKVICNDASSYAAIVVRNINGKRVYSKSISTVVDGFSEIIDISNSAKGIYFVEIQTDSYSYVKKVVVN